MEVLNLKQRLDQIEKHRLDAQIERDFMKGCVMKAANNNGVAWKKEQELTVELQQIQKQMESLKMQCNIIRADLSQRKKSADQKSQVKEMIDGYCQTNNDDFELKEEVVDVNEDSSQSDNDEKDYDEVENSFLKPKYVAAVAVAAITGIGFAAYKYIF